MRRTDRYTGKPMFKMQRGVPALTDLDFADIQPMSFSPLDREPELSRTERFLIWLWIVTIGRFL